MHFTRAEQKAMSGIWSFDQVRQFAGLLRKEVGDGWEWMVPAVREALVHQRAFSIVRGQDRVTVPVEEMDKLLRVMLVLTGLEKFDPEEFGLPAAAKDDA